MNALRSNYGLITDARRLYREAYFPVVGLSVERCSLNETLTSELADNVQAWIEYIIDMDRRKEGRKEGWAGVRRKTLCLRLITTCQLDFSGSDWPRSRDLRWHSVCVCVCVCHDCGHADLRRIVLEELIGGLAMGILMNYRHIGIKSRIMRRPDVDIRRGAVAYWISRSSWSFHGLRMFAPLSQIHAHIVPKTNNGIQAANAIRINEPLFCSYQLQLL